MTRLLMAAALVVATGAAAGSVQAQVPQMAAAPQQSVAPPYSARAYPSYPFALTPEDAYRDGLITRWEYERAAGPLPQALLGPPVDSNRAHGGDGRGS